MVIYTSLYWKALIGSKFQSKGLSCGSILSICRDVLKIVHLLDKRGFVDSQMVTNVSEYIHVKYEWPFYVLHNVESKKALKVNVYEKLNYS